MRIDDMDDLVTVEEIALYLGLSASTVYKLAKDGKVPAYRVARSWRFSKIEIQQWLNSESEIAAPAPPAAQNVPKSVKKKATAEKSKKNVSADEKLETQENKPAGAVNVQEMMSSGRELLMDSGILTGFTAVQADEFITTIGCERRKYAAGDRVLLENETLNKLCIIETGIVSVVFEQEDNTGTNAGSQLSKWIFQRGTVIAIDVIFTESRTNYIEYLADTECTIMVYSLASIRRYLTSNWVLYMNFTGNIINLLSVESIRRMKHIKILSDKRIRSKILFYLRLEEKKSGGSPFILQEGRMKMAAHLGVNRSVLSLELNRMKKDGIIDFNRNSFTLKEMARR